ncbi:MAG: peptidylprolyl isomerase [Candidatus Gracilibacteria bacterium]|nr:peptidylprolyl isomerase [Candidatus Gracilibacteria bacterium]
MAEKKQGPVQNGDEIAVHYRGTLEDGSQFDSSYDRGETLPFTVGAGQMIKGFDAGVVGMNVGEKKTLTLTPEEAYGEYSEEAKQVITKADLSSFSAAGFELVVGEKIPTQFGELEIIDADEENVTLDMNHPLAGKTLTFEVELVEIK